MGQQDQHASKFILDCLTPSDAVTRLVLSSANIVLHRVDVTAAEPPKSKTHLFDVKVVGIQHEPVRAHGSVTRAGWLESRRAGRYNSDLEQRVSLRLS